MSDTDEEEQQDLVDLPKAAKKPKRKLKISQFIDDEAELSSDDEGQVSSDENDDSDDDADLEELVDREAPELDSDEEEEVRALYHKQLANEDHRDVMIMQDHLEENAITYGQTRRKRFRWQEKELMENNLKRHYDPDDESDQDDDEDDDEEINYGEGVRPKLRRPDAESFLMKSTKIMTERLANKHSDYEILNHVINNDDSNSNLSKIYPGSSRTTKTSDIRGFLYKDKHIVEAISSTNREASTKTQEDKDRIVQRELNRVLHAKSVFDMFS